MLNGISSNSSRIPLFGYGKSYVRLLVTSNLLTYTQLPIVAQECGINMMPVISGIKVSHPSPVNNRLTYTHHNISSLLYYVPLISFRSSVLCCCFREIIIIIPLPPSINFSLQLFVTVDQREDTYLISSHHLSGSTAHHGRMEP